MRGNHFPYTTHYRDELDDGLEKDEAWEFLHSLPESERRELQSLEWSFRHINA